MMPSATSRGMVWFELAGGGVAWLGHLLISYAIGEFGCVSGFWTKPVAGVMGISWLLLGATLITVAVAGIALWVSHRSYRSFQPEGAGKDPRVTAESRYFMARIGLVTNAVFILIILVESIPIFYYLRDCGS